MITALQSKGFFQSLAEPNLIAYNGQEASFLAGGEVPGPDRAGRQPNAVTIMFKEFGIRLNFKPTIAGDIDPAEGEARSQHARLRQRHHARRASGSRR